MMTAAEETAVAFRVDGNADMGMGHVIRCLSLAAQIRRKVTPRVYFIMRGFDVAVERVIEDGYAVITLPQAVTREEEVSGIGDVIEKKSVSVLVIDTLDADGGLVAPLRSKRMKVAVIDDLGGKKFGADILINGSLVEEFTRYPAGAAERMLIGPQYMIVREDFMMQSLREKRIGREVRSIFVTLGGADPYRVIYSVTEAIEELDGQYEVTVALGKAFVDAAGFEKYVKGKKQAYAVMYNVGNLAALMGRADVAVVSGGMTLYELVSTRTPGLAICMNDSQVREAAEFEKRGAIINMGLWRQVTAAAIAERLGQLISDYKKRAQMQQSCRAITDGRGVSRVMEELFGK